MCTDDESRCADDPLTDGATQSISLFLQYLHTFSDSCSLFLAMSFKGSFSQSVSERTRKSLCTPLKKTEGNQSESYMSYIAALGHFDLISTVIKAIPFVVIEALFFFSSMDNVWYMFTYNYHKIKHMQVNIPVPWMFWDK